MLGEHGVRVRRLSKRTIRFSGRTISTTLEEPFWQALNEIATARGMSRPTLIGLLAEKRTAGNLSSVLRVFVLEHFRAATRGAHKRRSAVGRQRSKTRQLRMAG